jgi:ribosome-associated toxin RatA of RatAB toxin-antitoxin module
VEAEVSIEAPMKAVWEVLTDYDSLADFIPGMTESRLLERDQEGRALIEQKGALWHFPLVFERRLVLSVKEKPMRHIAFRMREGDFDSYGGHWRLRRMQGTVSLNLSIEASHPTGLPRFLVARSLKRAAKRSLLAIAREVERRTQGK